jgi:hypothetical protein
MPITKIAHSSFEVERENYINILRSGHSVTDTGWTTYSDSAGVNPVDGIGGTASITWSQNTSNPLSGDSDLRLVKDTVNRQGNGVSIPFTIANRHSGNEYTVLASVPIAGWGSSVAMSSDSGDGRVVVAIVKNLQSGKTTSNGFYWSTIQNDTHNAIRTTGSGSTQRTEFVAPLSGYYRVSCTVNFNNTGAVNIYKNSSVKLIELMYTTTANISQNLSSSVFLNAGDFIYIATSTTYTSNSDSDVGFSIERISAGSQMIATQETVACSYYATSTTTVPALQRIVFNAKIFDTHGAVTTGSIGSNNWKFTAPMSGKYSISGQIVGSSGAQIHLYKNDAIWYHSYTYLQSSGTDSIDGLIELNAGDFIDFRSNVNNVVNGNTPSASAYASRIEIIRVGV